VIEGHEPIRSYQRIFRPERRLYTIEGRALPVPGGVPLRWLAYATGSLVVVLALSARSPTLAALAGFGAALAGLAAGGRVAGELDGGAAFLAVPVFGFLVSLLDWPLRLVVLPALVATLATQASPDGRRADRYALSWISLRLRARRRSLGRALPPWGLRLAAASVWVAPDERSPRLRRGQVRGPAELSLRAPAWVRRRRRGRLTVRPAPPGLGARRWSRLDSLELGAGERAVIRP
jgi:hypothetical protein